MTVSEAIEQLMEQPLEAELVVCAHEFQGLENMGWHVNHFEATDDGSRVLLEGVVPPPCPNCGNAEELVEWYGEAR